MLGISRDVVTCKLAAVPEGVADWGLGFSSRS